MSEVKAKTPQGDISLDQLASIQPGMAKIMRDVSERYYYTYYSARGGNWKLAAHQLNQVRTAFRVAKVTRPKFAEDLDEFDRELLQPILQAIQAKDWGAFERAYMAGVEGSDKYHDKWGYNYIRFVLPAEPPQDLHLGPPEKFSRKPGTQG